MKEIIRIILLVLNIVSFVIIAIIGVLGILSELLGPAKFDDLLKSLNIPLNFNILWKLSIIFIPILIITFVIRKKLGGAGNIKRKECV